MTLFAVSSTIPIFKLSSIVNITFGSSTLGVGGGSIFIGISSINCAFGASTLTGAGADAFNTTGTGAGDELITGAFGGVFVNLAPTP